MKKYFLMVTATLVVSAAAVVGVEAYHIIIQCLN